MISCQKISMLTAQLETQRPSHLALFLGDVTAGRDLRSLSLSCSRGLSLTLSLSLFGDSFLLPGEKERAFGSL